MATLNAELNPSNLPVGDGSYVLDFDNDGGRIRQLPGTDLYAVDFIDSERRKTQAMVHESEPVELDELIGLMNRLGCKVVDEATAREAAANYDTEGEFLRRFTHLLGLDLV